MGMPVKENLSNDEIMKEPVVTANKNVSTSEDIQSVVLMIRDHVSTINKTVQAGEQGHINRILRGLVATRKKLNPKVLELAAYYIYPSSEIKDRLLTIIVPDPKQKVVLKPTKSMTSISMPIPEVDAYFRLLMLINAIDEDRLEDAKLCAKAASDVIAEQNRRSLDGIAARIYFYLSRVAELRGEFSTLRAPLHSRLRTCTLRNDYEGQAVILNCLLRNYLHYNLYEQADKLVSKSTFPESASNNEWARYLFYLGRIKAARLEYSAAHKHLVQAMRKAPQCAALGFQLIAQKLAIVVELLLGDIPEKQVFRQPGLRRSLFPYLQLTKTVRMGNLQAFGEVLDQFSNQFQADNTCSLILRLRNNVIKTAIRSIGMAYARITPADVAKKLGLDSKEDAEFMVAKAIRDGVIEATIDPECGCIKSKETADIYRTREPQLAFHERISFCLDLHNQSVKSMRFPPKKPVSNLTLPISKEQQFLEIVQELSGDPDEDDF
ncbi:probable 26S proteasome non-ATPase regulatory subunit 3 [Ctenocephalides felis]|uniref:probable 26S proteasome non-ATPase regulatory subunit 3 n=1 Tax=Ctenocephalides felis TaxID=7515 RepID=UPI000E6E1F3B|nr:probable 26S proteasome non-ATPase regulatory subunit 3 [Ctenocephalides felis]